MLQIIKASAGSGKTYTLALEYITLLLGEKDSNGNYHLSKEEKREYHRHILAVTFTNKATEEMKERIIKELAVLAGRWEDGKSPYMQTLCKRFGESDEMKIRKAADRALGELLFDFTNFNVSTIDSFFQIILRTFAGEIDVPQDYNIELNDGYAMQSGIRDFLSSLRFTSLASRSGGETKSRRRGNALVGWLKKYVSEKINEGLVWNIFSMGSKGSDSDLFNFAKVINTELYRKASAAMTQYFQANDGGNVGKLQLVVSNLIKRYTNDIMDNAKLVLQIVEEHGYTDFLQKKGAAQMVRNFAAGEIELRDSQKVAPIYGYLEAPDKVLKQNKKDADGRQATIYAIEPCFETLNQLYADLHLLDRINQNIYMLGLLSGISGSVGRFRQDNNLILLSDTNELLNDVISEDDTPFIYERIGVWINNFLVDEFQDTSALQWQNFKPLLSNSLSSGNDNLIIGDEKQCIYRFRNSDPSLLQYKVQEQFQDRQVKVSGDKSTNWRSTPVVVRFNNTFFTQISRIMNVEDVYNTVVQMPNDKKRGLDGYVRVEMIDTASQQQEGGETKNSQGAFFKQAVLDRLPGELGAILDRGYRQSDIAILVYSNDDGAAVIERLLQYNLEENAIRKFEIISSDSLLLKNNPTVRLIISHLRYLSVAVELRDGQKTKKQEAEEQVHRLLRQYENLLNQGMTPEQAMETVMTTPESKEKMLGEIDEFVPRNAPCHNLVSVVERIIEKTVTPEAKERENPFIAALQDYVIDYCMRTVNISIRSFIDWWDRNSDDLSITSPAGVDAINVMTIHKSKGLEFPCVVIPFATWDMCKGDSTMWITREELLATHLFDDVDTDVIPPLLPVKSNKLMIKSRLADAYEARERESIVDSLNKTYVAFTRAVDELHLFSYVETKKEGELSDKMQLGLYLKNFAEELNYSNLVETLNTHYGTDVAIGVEMTETGYSVGKISENDREKKPPQKINPMNPYFVVNRHNLARFDLPEVFYTPNQERGVLLHRILGMIHNIKELDRCLKYCKVRCVVLPEQYDEVSALVRQMLVQNDEVVRWFAHGNKVYKERSIMVKGQKYRPDRVVVTPEGETIVIDFKFGDLHSPHYKNQVLQYMELVSDAGLKQVSGRIWYPLEGVIENVQ